MSGSAVDLFAGPGGWSVACRRLGIDEIGIEIDAAACATRDANGFATIQADVRTLGPADFADDAGLIASPPCQTFSAAGSGAGRRSLDTVLSAVKAMGAGQTPDTSDWSDERTALVLEPLRWALEAAAIGMPYRWIALEQVPTVLPVWQAMAEQLQAIGYSTAVGNLQAEQYGVPQTRRRAILIARLDGQARLPEPTHSRFYPRNRSRLDPGVLPWVSMADALEESPHTAADGDTAAWVSERPSPTIVGSFRPEIVAAPGWRKAGDGPRQNAPGSVRVTVEEASTLQSFPPGFVWEGSKTKRYQQVGNAIPPSMAEAVLRSASITERG